MYLKKIPVITFQIKYSSFTYLITIMIILYSQLWLSIIATAIATCGGAQIIASVFPSIFKTIL